jgi:Uma2 family endonuclease
MFSNAPEYWIVDPIYRSLEQYVLQAGAYSPPTLYIEDEPIASASMSCVAFTMNELMAQVPPDLP